MSNSFTADGFDFEDLGLVIERAPDQKSGVRVGYKTAPLPGRHGDVHLTRDGQGRARAVTLTCVVTGSDLADLRSKLDEIKWRLEDRTVQLTLPDQTDRYWSARLENPQAIGFRPDVVANRHRFRIRFLMVDPFAYATSETTVSLSSVATSLPIGNAPSYPTLSVGSPSTGFTFEYRNSAAALQTTLTLSASTGTTVVVNNLDLIITSDGANFSTALSTGSDFICLDPRDRATFSTGSQPTGTLLGGSSGKVVYRMAWR
jgi:hypothetical protein